MSKDDIKPGEQLTLAQINRLRKQAQGGGKAASGNDSDTGQGDDQSTRSDLDEALAALPDDYDDADYVVNAMRKHFGDIFTDADEARVRELVGVGGKPSDGMKVDELRAALEAKSIDIPADAKKADLQKLLDEAA